MDMTMAIVNHSTIAIDAYQYNTSDDDHFNGHYYSNKAPGQSLLGVPVFVVYKAALGIPPVRTAVNLLEANSAWRLALQDARCTVAVPKDPCRFVPPRLDFALLQYVESIFTAAVPSLLMLLLFFWFLGYFSSSLLNRALLTVALGLGTMIFPYSQEFYSHVPATDLDFAGFVLVFVAGMRGRHPRPGTERLVRHPAWTVFLAGLLLGLSVVFEYPAALVVLLIGIYALYRLPTRLIFPLVAGTVPGLVIVMTYNFAAYHDPFTTGYGCNEKRWYQECRGIAGFTWPPSGVAIRDMSVGRYRGLFFLSPFLLLAIPGYFLWFMKSKTEKATSLLCLSIPIIFFSAISMYWGWFGGQVAGPRYLMELVPFLTLPVIFALDHFRSPSARVAIYALGAISFLNVWAETIGGRAYPSGGMHNPLFDYSLPALGAGSVPLNLGMFLGLTGGISLLPLCLVLTAWTTLMLLTASTPADGLGSRPR